MKRKLTLCPLRFLIPSHRRKPSISMSNAGAGSLTRAGITSTQIPQRLSETARFAEFRALSFVHLEAIYSDALCLARSRDEAAELVVTAYVRAFLHYASFRHRRAWITVDWLYANLHAVYCDEILARANRSRRLNGG